jgi:RHH-type transcriptional regulator, rel operon repressor / antitoxin RelB
VLGIRLEAELDARLERLAKRIGRSKSYYAREAIRQFVEEREDHLLGLAVLERKELTISLEELERRLGLAHRVHPDRRKTHAQAESAGAG